MLNFTISSVFWANFFGSVFSDKNLFAKKTIVIRGVCEKGLMSHLEFPHPINFSFWFRFSFYSHICPLFTSFRRLISFIFTIKSKNN